MDQAEPCRSLVEVRPMVLGLFMLVQTVLTTWLVQRRLKADKREAHRTARKSQRLSRKP